MSNTISGSTAISGLSGMDTNFDDVLEKLYTVEKSQLNQLQAWKSDWQLRYDAFNTVIDQMSAAKQMLATIGSVNHFVSKEAKSSNEAVLTALATGSAADGQHRITVEKMANNAVWCNCSPSAVFQDKSDIITQTATTFEYDYAGRHYSQDIAANTTLESFVSIINNSSNNPGITVSLVNTGSGYVYQIAGKDTGAENSLTIYSSAIKGMEAAGSTSTWQTNSAFAVGDAITNPTQYTYNIVRENGQTFSVSISGDSTDDELLEKIQRSVGDGLITGTKDASGNITFDGVRSITRNASTEDAYVEGGLKVKFNDPTHHLVSAESTDTLDVTVTMDDGTYHTFQIDGSARRQDLIAQLKQAAASSANPGLNAQGTYELNLGGVSSIQIENGGVPVDVGFTTETYAATGTNSVSTTLDASKLTLTFDPDKLTKRLDGLDDPAEPGKDLWYTIVRTDGTSVDFRLTSDQTNQDLKDAVLANGGVLNSDGDVVLGDAAGNVKNFYLFSGSASSGFTTKISQTATLAASTTTGKLEDPPDVEYDLSLNDGTSLHLNLGSSTTIEGVRDAIQNELTTRGISDVTVSLVDEDGNEVTSPTSGQSVYLQVSNIQSMTGPKLAGQVVASSNWSITNASNAVYRVDNWPMAMQSSSNTITDLLDGVSMTLQGVGESTLTISTDITSVEKSIQNFLDAVNSVLLTIRQLTAVEDDKEVTSNDPNDIGNSNYSKSTLTAEKGGLLTGNYGVQLVKSRFMSVVTGTPPGFQSMASADDLLSGDILSCLSNMGIKTDTDSTSETYGLLVISPSSDFLQQMDEENYQDMINNHVNELVDFFVADGKGTSTSADFRYSSHISGITEAGTYDVHYDVDSAGNILNVTIGGESCSREESRGGYYYTCTSGPARGLAISIDDLNVGSHSGQVRIRQGLVQTVKGFLDKELTYNDVNITTASRGDVLDAQISLKSQNGAMMTLKANYASIMSNIDKSISKEQTRLDLWYSRQKKVFSNLETLLSELSAQKTQLESQLGQLS